MIRLCWIFVLAVIVPLSYARPHNCEQRERSLADLDLVEDSLNRAKLLYPNCEDESSNSSECSKKDKSLGFIDVALDLVSNAKKSIPICPHVPTEDPLNVTEEPLTKTEEPKPEVTPKGFSPMDCQEWQAAGYLTSGVYTVWTRGKSVQVRCDMDKDGGGWTVIQRRGNFSKQENFDRDWQDYKNGFGNLERDFWIGNDPIFSLSNRGNYSLRMDMTTADGESAYVLYQDFRIEDENASYTLRVGEYTGTAGDSFLYKKLEFSTKDRKNGESSQNCASDSKGGFWYGVDCYWCNPNGLYKPGLNDIRSIFHHSFKKYIGLLSFEMKIKRLP